MLMSNNNDIIIKYYGNKFTTKYIVKYNISCRKLVNGGQNNENLKNINIHPGYIPLFLPTRCTVIIIIIFIHGLKPC